jgi:hypothetical protein
MTAPPASKFFAFGKSDVGVGRNSRPKKPCAALFGDEDRRALFGSFVEYEDAVTNDSAGFGTSEVRRFLELLSANVEFEKRNPASSGSAADGHDSAARKTPDSQAHERASIRIAPRSFRVRDQALRQHRLLPAVVFGHSWNTTVRDLARCWRVHRKVRHEALGAPVHL